MISNNELKYYASLLNKKYRKIENKFLIEGKKIVEEGLASNYDCEKVFITGKFLNMQELVSFSDLNPIMIKELIEKLKEKYNRDDSAIEIVERNSLWKMDIKHEYSGIVNKLAAGDSEFTGAEKGTLAIIAYKHPIKQSVIIKIRGNKAYEHIKKFFDLKLITKKKQGHTYEIGLSDEFYNYFNASKTDNFLKSPES